MNDIPSPTPDRPLLVLLKRLWAWLFDERGDPATPTPSPPPPPSPSPAHKEAGFPVHDSVSIVSNSKETGTQSEHMPRSIGPRGIALIKRFEGCARIRADGLIEAYPDPGSGGEPWTIGWGATGADHGHGGRIGPDTVWTQAQCDERLARDLRRYASEVAQALKGAPATQGQFDALVSFHYNTGAIARATLTKKHIARDYAGAAAEFARWNKAGGRVLRGLTRRRAAEAALYQS
ncbi:lysozyme [Erythrobacter sp. T5W1-R]|uniref:lysozyme n=1 Tax=Erythrobacter sp. T5W1-R TaxID=3101752 RepID=UPI002AFE00FE|nr:lysozyme [Erythrobacter sp. T5W1-R]MEA1617510.1 lysozyme [Erythrobacter sp. T5W1-R]